jgi:protein-S-isoprenylcysteine O-methyltransferase Ste14
LQTRNKAWQLGIFNSRNDAASEWLASMATHQKAAQAPALTHTRSTVMKRILKWLLSGLYGLVMIEVVIMISPFAFYWYSLYAPTLQGLHRWPATAWMEAFFLPHSVITTSSLLEFNRWVLGTYALSIGILGFLFCAVQIYGGKLLKKGPAISWIYRRIRHPQYLFLSIAGFGLLTVWPRIIILILYFGMIVAYYWLARFEEKQVEAKFPEYAEYRKRTAMFIPGNPGGKIYRLLFGWIPSRGLGLAASTCAATLLIIGSGLVLRSYTIRHTATDLLPRDRIMGIAIWPMPAAKIERVVNLALNDPRVRGALGKEPGAVFTAHLLPADYGMVNMFADVGTDHRMFSRISPGRFKYLLTFVFPFIVTQRRNRIMGRPENSFKVVFSRVDKPGRPLITADHITDLSAKMTPIVIANIRALNGGADPAVEGVLIPPRRSFWGDITMPMF